MVAYSFKERFIAPISKGLGRVVIEGFGPPIPIRPDILPKRQTIRAIGKRRHARPGEIVQLYYGMRTKQCRSIGVAKCTAVRPITLRVCNDGDLLVTIERRMMPEKEAESFAKKDGFGSIEDMWLFWREEHPGTEYFNGIMIEWEPIT